MKIDNTLARIITEVQKAVADKYGIDLNFDQVHEVVEVQLTSTAYGLARNIPTHWRGFLKFVWTNKRARQAKFNELFASINEQSHNLTDKERDYYTYLAGVAAGSARQELDVLGRNAKALTTEEVKATPTDNNKFRQFTCLIKQR